MYQLKRESYLDIAKGLGIIMVILGHIEIGFATKWLYSFHLPLFFFVSGICFHYKENFFHYLKKKVKRCLIPYFVFGILIVLVESKTGYLYNTGFKSNLTYLLVQQRYSTLWFLATLFFASIFFYFLVKFCNEKPAIVLTVSLVISTIFVILDQILISSLPWNIDTAFIVLGFMGFGYFIRNYKDTLNRILAADSKKKQKLALLFLIGNVAFFAINLIITGYSLEMYWNSYGIYPLTYISAILGCMFIIVISDSIKIKAIESLGRNSMTYFALHQSIFLWPYTLLLRRIGLITSTPSILNVISKLILFVLIIISCFVVDKIIRLTRLKFIVEA